MPTPRYRTVGGESSVDESLFGSGSGTSSSMGRTTRRIVTGPLSPNDTVLSEQDLMKITQGSIIKTEAQYQADRERVIAEKAAKAEKAGERKLRMKELEKHAQASLKKSDSEIAEMSKAATLRALAQEKMDKNSDVVKLLNSMSARAIAFSVRDKQLHEKEEREKVDEEIDRRLDILMEIDRLKDLHRRESEEREKVTKRAKDREVITEQIELRQRARMLELEAREQESHHMRNLIKKYEDEDARSAAEHQKEVEKSRAEVTISNADAIRRKHEIREANKKEMEDILLYQALKDAELAKREADELEIANAKKLRQATLLAQQERAQNNAGKLDEMRARRAAEERERRARAAEREKAQKQAGDIKELLASRAKQAADKKLQADREKIYEVEEIKNSLRYMETMAAREAEEARIKHHKSMNHRERLFAQIDANEKRRGKCVESSLSLSLSLSLSSLHFSVFFTCFFLFIQPTCVCVC